MKKKFISHPFVRYSKYRLNNWEGRINCILSWKNRYHIITTIRTSKTWRWSLLHFGAPFQWFSNSFEHIIERLSFSVLRLYFVSSISFWLFACFVCGVFDSSSGRLNGILEWCTIGSIELSVLSERHLWTRLSVVHIVSDSVAIHRCDTQFRIFRICIWYSILERILTNIFLHPEK